MKLISMLATALFTTMTALSFGVQAADADKGTEAKTPVAEMQTDQTPAKKAKRHSHVDEKTGMPMSQSASAKSDKTEAAQDKPAASKAKADKDKSKHYHPRDGK